MILVVEDNQQIADYLVNSLSQAGFSVLHAADGIEGLQMVETYGPELIILDWMLPRLDGLSVLRELRKKQIGMPVLFLTAKGELEDKLQAFELGADDYLAKPFSTAELVARVQARLRNSTSKSESSKLIYADIEVNLSAQKVLKNSKAVVLSSKEFKLLCYFIRHAGQTLSRTRLAECVWDIHHDTETNVIDVAVKRLREKLGDTNPQNRLIQTHRGVGYRLESQA